MSRENEDIKDELGKFSSRFGPKIILPATVRAINNDDTIAIEFSDDSTVDDARLKSVIKDGNKVLLIPKVGSIVLVAKIENSDEYLVVAVEEITEQRIQIGTVTFKITDEGFLIQKGGETLKKIFDDLLEEIKKLTVNTNVGPSSVPINILAFETIKTRVNNFLQ